MTVWGVMWCPEYGSRPFHLAVLDAAEEYGDAPALVFSFPPPLTSLIQTDGDDQLSFIELRRRSFVLAGSMRDLGLLKKGEIVVLFLPNCSSYAVVFLASALIGCPISGINPESTPGVRPFPLPWCS